MAGFVALPAVAVAQPQHGGTFAFRGGDSFYGECISVYRTTRALRAYRHPRREGASIRTVERGRLIALNDRDMAITVVRSTLPAQALEPVRFDVTSYGTSN